MHAGAPVETNVSFDWIISKATVLVVGLSAQAVRLFSNQWIAYNL